MSKRNSNVVKNDNIRSEVKKLVGQIETLAHQVSDKLDNGTIVDVLAAANELVKNSSTFTFVLGNFYQAEKNVIGSSSTVKKVKNAAMRRTNYYNVRGPNGKFLKRP